MKTPAPTDGTIGLRIRMLREKLGVSLRGTAEEAEINAGYLSKIERGLRDPSTETLMRVATALEIPPIELAGHDGACCWCCRDYNGPARYVTTTDDQHVIVSVTPKFAELVEYTPEELHGRLSYDLLDEEDRKMTESRRRELARNGGTLIGTLVLVSRSGRRIRYDYRMVTVLDGETTSYVVAGRPHATLPGA